MCVSNYGYPTSGSDIKSTTIYCHVSTHFLLRPEILHAVLSLAGCLIALFLHKGWPQSLPSPRNGLKILHNSEASAERDQNPFWLSVLSGLYAPSCGLPLSEVIFLTRLFYPLLAAFLHNSPELPNKHSLQNIPTGWQKLPLSVPRGLLCTMVCWRQVPFGW